MSASTEVSSPQKQHDHATAISTESSRSLLINLEPLQEHQIIEVAYDGQEIYKPPSTFAEHFTKILNQIDFADESLKFEDVDGSIDIKSEGKCTDAVAEAEFPSNDAKATKFKRSTNLSFHEDDSEIMIDGDCKPAKLSKNDLTNVRSKIQNALTEVSVLFDVLQLAKDEKFISTDLCAPFLPNSSSNPQSELNPNSAQDSTAASQHSTSFMTIAKRKSFADSVSLLTNFASKMRERQLQQSKSDCEFYQQLLELRKFWKIKKTQYTILGELAIQSSSFHHSSVFEIVKRDGVLDVILPRDLENFNYEIEINFTDSTDFDALINFGNSNSTPSHLNSNVDKKSDNYSLKSIHLKLQNAQKSFINKEIFSQMCKEGTHMKLACQCCLLDDRIICYLTETLKMIVSLRCTRRNSIGSSARTDSNSKYNVTCTQNPNAEDADWYDLNSYRSYLVVFIKKLYLYYIEKTKSTEDFPNPVTLPVFSNQKYLNATASGSKKATYEELTKTKGLLESTIDYALHLDQKRMVYSLIEDLQRNYKCIRFTRRFREASTSLSLVTETCFTLCMAVKKLQYAKGTKLINIIIRGQLISFATNDSWKYNTTISCLVSLLKECVNELLVSIFLTCAASFTWVQLGYSGSSFASTYSIAVLHPNNLSKLSFSVLQNGTYLIKYLKPIKAPLVPEDTDVIQDLTLYQLSGDWIEISYSRIPGSDIFQKFEHLFSTFL